jgi:hypothetical protein
MANAAAGARTCRVLVPSGVIGSGCPQAAIDRGITLRPHAIAVDAGSTDSGPHYLGTGSTKMTRKALKRDLRQLMLARDTLRVPLLIGSCGTCGTDSGVDMMAALCAEIAHEENLEARVARVYSEQQAETLAPFLARGAISPLAPARAVTQATLDECTHIVALLGHAPLVAALDAGADIVLAGRTTDTAVLAAVPLMRGLPPEHCWHAAKVAECGGFCTTRTDRGGVLFEICENGYTIEPLHADNACTPYSVAAHLLYENADPFVLKEPGIELDTSNAQYEAIDARRVHVHGASIRTMTYTLKLEGAAAIGYRTMGFTAIADPHVLRSIDAWVAKLRQTIVRGAQQVLGHPPGSYELDLRAYGWNALNPDVARAPEPPPREVGVMLLVTAPTQAMASEIARWANPYLLHLPLHDDDPMPSFAFPYSPAEAELGAVFEFRLNHVVQVEDPLALSRMRIDDARACTQ